MIGIVVPAHNEEECLAACLMALVKAANYPQLKGRYVEIIVVLDACTDASKSVVTNFIKELQKGNCQVRYIEISAKNVGIARATGVTEVLKGHVSWLAFTDADTRVAPDWLVAQLALEADVVCGTVQVDDWSAHGDMAGMLALHFASTYRDVEGHNHIHGANLSMSTKAYLQSGGFKALAAHEDVTLVSDLIKRGARIAWSAAPRVITSARCLSRTARGFGNTLSAFVEHYRQEGTAEGFIPPA